jgi:glutamate dehydrogenase/leucine dehydrogenase/pimeloyl-ACP methyl ester carboxylesterase
MSSLDHEQIVIRTGPRSKLPIIAAVHSSALGQAVGGCRLWYYPTWQDGLTDALRLSAGMTAKCAVAGLANGGGKTVVAMPEGFQLTPSVRLGVLQDVADVIESLDGCYATGPDVGTSPDDMAVIGERPGHVFCRSASSGGSGDSSPATAMGTVAALRAVGSALSGTRDLSGRRLAVVGLGSVGSLIARQLAQEGAELVLSDIDPGKRVLSTELGATWSTPDQALTADVDFLIPAALGGVLSQQLVPVLRCTAVVGPANNQLATPEVADLLHERGITWIPDHVVSAGGVINALSVELHHATPAQARTRVEAIENTVAGLLTTGTTPNQAAHDLARQRLASVGELRAPVTVTTTRVGGIVERIERTVTAPDGRTLAVQEAGDPAGRPVFVHLGTPMNRQLYGPHAADAASRGLRLISYDRPGYGGSTPQPGRIVADCATDVRAICAALGLSRIAVWGISGGGPYALATAALLPDLVVAAASLDGPAPFEADGMDWFDGMGKDNADGFRLRLTDPAAARDQDEAGRKMVLATSAADLAEELGSLFSPVDAAAFTGELADYVIYNFRAALTPGIEGWEEDHLAQLRPWGFELGSISVPVLVVHGRQDQLAPFGHGRWLAAHVPGGSGVAS